MNNSVHKKGALAGYRVLDLTDEKGVLCAKILADSGADVIRIEQPDRQAPPYYLNAGKRSITLNLQDTRGGEIFKRLVKTADILVESHQAGYMENLGLSYPALSKINPRLIMASITDFGQTGPYRDYTSCDLVASALGGQMYVCGESDKPPLKPFGNQTYYTASVFAATGILLALWSRHTTGKGQYIDISLQDSAAAALDHVLVRYFYEGIVSIRQGSLHWNGAFRIFPCRDGYILLSLFQHWETLVEWLDSEGMAEDLTDRKWLKGETRLQNINHIIDILERWTRRHAVDELVEKGQLMHFPWAKVTSVPELLHSPQLKERDFFIELTDPKSGKRFTAPGAPVRMSASPFLPGSSIPGHGEHTREILCGELGLSGKELESLSQDGVI